MRWPFHITACTGTQFNTNGDKVGKMQYKLANTPQRVVSRTRVKQVVKGIQRETANPLKAGFKHKFESTVNKV